MVFKKRKNGQAAIEFLMTYGWMLLVVLIVGALIFSFVDFGSLLPNKLDLSQSFRADASQILPSAAGNDIKIFVTYIGSKSGSVEASSVEFVPTVGNPCDFSTDADLGEVNITNIDTGNSVVSNAGNNDVINFVNGQRAIFKFTCHNDNTMIENDVIEADIKIPVVNPVTKFEIASKGTLRAVIQE